MENNTQSAAEREEKNNRGREGGRHTGSRGDTQTNKQRHTNRQTERRRDSQAVETWDMSDFYTQKPPGGGACWMGALGGLRSSHRNKGLVLKRGCTACNELLCHFSLLASPTDTDPVFGVFGPQLDHSLLRVKLALPTWSSSPGFHCRSTSVSERPKKAQNSPPKRGPC